MMFRTHLRRAPVILAPVIATALVGYFAYYAVEGERGLRVLSALQTQSAHQEAKLAGLKSERQSLEHKVISLRPDSLDLDRLDERTRVLLNDSRADELIIDLAGGADAPVQGQK